MDQMIDIVKKSLSYKSS